MKFSGELHEVKLINFSIDKEELKGRLPKRLKVFDYEGRALISMVDVHLKKMMMHRFLPSFAYRHVAFRLLIDDGEFSKAGPKGIYFLQSFSSNALMVLGGNWVANYNLTLAKMAQNQNEFVLHQKEKYLNYTLDPFLPAEESEILFAAVRRIDRAYSFAKDAVSVTQITRKEWPIETVMVKDFSTNFFASAKLEGAFSVKKTIPYIWEQSVKIKYA